jgi:hypothetical protein
MDISGLQIKRATVLNSGSYRINLGLASAASADVGARARTDFAGAEFLAEAHGTGVGGCLARTWSSLLSRTFES